MNYEEYIRSDLWKSRAQSARRRAGHRCQVCNSERGPLHVHHRTYERLGVEHHTDLTVLCAECHALFHGRIPKITAAEQRTRESHATAARLAMTPRRDT